MMKAKEIQRKIEKGGREKYRERGGVESGKERENYRRERRAGKRERQT